MRGGKCTYARVVVWARAKYDYVRARRDVRSKLGGKRAGGEFRIRSGTDNWTQGRGVYASDTVYACAQRGKWVDLRKDLSAKPAH